MDALSDSAKAPIYLIENILCDEDLCHTEVGGTILYSDAAHLSIEDSVIIFEEFDIASVILGLARLNID